MNRARRFALCFFPLDASTIGSKDRLERLASNIAGIRRATRTRYPNYARICVCALTDDAFDIYISGINYFHVLPATRGFRARPSSFVDARIHAATACEKEHERSMRLACGPRRSRCEISTRNSSRKTVATRSRISSRLANASLFFFFFFFVRLCLSSQNSLELAIFTRFDLDLWQFQYRARGGGGEGGPDYR